MLERFMIGLVGVMSFNCSKTGFISLNSKDISAQLQPKTFYTFVNRVNDVSVIYTMEMM
jgi:hypothetical protein